MTPKENNAFSSALPNDARYNDENNYHGISAAEYAAIHLRVPKSGTPWLDEMIAEANRRDLIASMMQGIVANNQGVTSRHEIAYLNAKLYADQIIERLKPAK